jgi:hypothetical protein
MKRMRIATLLGAGLSLLFGVACTSGTPASVQPAVAAAGNGAVNAAGASAAGAPAAAAAPADYSNTANWLCRPGQMDACTADLSTTVVAADGTLTPEPYAPNAAPPIDCFYVYPTISNDTTPNSDLVAGPEEKGVALAQFARFGSQCRLFAPVYRQVTLASLRAALTEGAGVLTQLIASTLDTQPLDPRLISALLIGTTVSVPKGADVGGTFKNLPFCRANEQLGCVISYASFRATAPPPASSRFAQAMDPNLVGGCSNPAALAGGAAPLHAYLNANGPGLTSAPPGPWTMASPTVPTPFVSVPGLLTAECIAGERGSYLSITINADPADPRTDDITGDVLAAGMVQADWGLHVIDMHLAMGNLVDQVAAKAAAYAARSGAPATAATTP